MNSRRLIFAPRLRTRDRTDLHQRQRIKSPLSSQPMSALGQKQTFALHQLVSALPPKADIRHRNWHVRFGPKADILAMPRQCPQLTGQRAPAALRAIATVISSMGFTRGRPKCFVEPCELRFSRFGVSFKRPIHASL